MNAPRPAWREPVVWLMAGIPLATIVAGLLTLRIAGGSGALDAAPEAVRRTAQAQTTDLTADQAAARLGLRAALSLGGDGVLVVRSDTIAADAGPLWLHLVHPASADGDMQMVLQREDGAWRGRAALDPRIAWGLRLGDAGGHWRLVAKVAPGQREAALQPALRP
jgi:hypothetical protein